MKRSGLICLVALLALGSLGVSYATWSQNMTVQGSVATGTFDVIFSNVKPPSPLNDATFTPAPSLSNQNHALTIYLNNIYPSLDATFDFDLKDIGTVPARVTDVTIDGYSVVGSSYQLSKPLGTGHTTNDITIRVGNITTATTIDANNSTVTGHLTVHCWGLTSSPTPDANDATANASGSFTVEIDTAQRY